MEDDGETEYSPDDAKADGWRKHSPAIGCVSGGCVVPILFFFYCAFVYNDAGGPLFWPIFSGFAGIVGLAIGTVVRSLLQR
jgi:hypothetical protein